MALLALAAPVRAGEAWFLIVCGSGGEAAYSAKFAEWGARLSKALEEKCGRSTERISLLTEEKQPEGSPRRRSTLEGVGAAIGDLAARVKPTDDVFLFLIGHGSALRNEPKIQLPGPDLSAAALGEMLGRVRAARIAIVDASSSSSGFINLLAAPNRAIVTATRSLEESNATIFMEQFLQALEEGSADQNRDERISLLEASRQAAQLTEARYTSEGLIATEHALIEDNGDGMGTRLAESDSAKPLPPPVAPDGGKTVVPPAEDGALAGAMWLKDFSFPAGAPPELVERYMKLMDDVEKLKAEKAKMAVADYYAMLEGLLIEAARVHRRVRGADNASLRDEAKPQTVGK